ncbi:MULTISPECIES: hypothetical protein [Pseudoalteromonas]|jgi:outer membrane cobalamin receptor|uniref:Orphan protein n=3 Tax=Pseudoalteromonas TaxID=53246 RepID=A0AAD0TZW5_9GAMM|nr:MULTISPECIES: hypothetical protein [Pseudoalteromonas]MAJ41014.1 hypothetical protein [Pseudoalteromonadaceae bacterium]MDC9522577.1 hypothetical protein [Pseudoalteromonas sp. Angola-31]MDY6887848.1 hypothetical protein [Pseudomonadota bacterium]OUX84866.1 MAG: hypothetical protein CBC03_13740 [Pseudoalteromonas sp. TMED43]HBW97991.1 hypothetical protein [Pseudoalteromonas sp.]|tara:strand:+ start:878 stop:1114 length:237 start_codon:yes stop_codon:yes gene_type:complete
MQTFIKTSALALSFSLLAACQNQVKNPELNQCAQQNYQCENSCDQQSIDKGLKQQVCSAKCVESYNQCKAQAQKLTDL